MIRDNRTIREVEKKRSLHNRKPYRTKGGKRQAREVAFKGDDGAWHSEFPVRFHPAPKLEDL